MQRIGGTACAIAVLLSLSVGADADPASPDPAAIPALQGSGRTSPLAGRAVVVTGVVTQRSPDGGFWVQDPVGDGDPATSDGVYVTLDGASAGIAAPRVADRVRIAGTVQEDAYRTELPRTQIGEVTSVEVLSSGNPLPDPVALTRLPDVDLADAETFWEPLEGMRVVLRRGIVVGPTEASGEISVLAEENAVEGSGFHPGTGHVILRRLPERGFDQVDYNPELIVLQALSGEAPQVRPGDELTDVVGTVDPLEGYYKVRLDAFTAHVRGLPAVPASRRSGEPGNVRVVSYNLRDLFDTMDHPAQPDDRWTPTPRELDVRLDKLALSIVEELELPQVIVVNELENTAVLQAVGDRVNERAGTRYRAASVDTPDPRGLEVGFLYDESRADLLDFRQIAGPDVQAAFVKNDENPIFVSGRQPLVGSFRFSESGPVLHVVANKFKTKRLEDPRLSTHETPVRRTEVQRKSQARVVRRWVDERLAEDPDALILVTGDLGDFQFPEPGEGKDHPIGIIAGLGDQIPLTNLIDLEDPGETFTYVFQGNSMAMTHMLVSPALLEMLAGFDVLHFNAGFPDGLTRNPRTPFRASDRDPPEGRFDFPGVED
jgi:predicted extracellular nuclease